MYAPALLLIIAIALPLVIMASVYRARRRDFDTHIEGKVWAGNLGSQHAHAIDPDTGWSVCGMRPLKGWAGHMKDLPPEVPACKACLAGVGGRKVAA